MSLTLFVCQVLNVCNLVNLSVCTSDSVCYFASLVVCSSVHLSVCIICWSVVLPEGLSACNYVLFCIRISVCMLLCRYLSFCPQSVCLSVCLSVFLFVYQSEGYYKGQKQS